jgi:hypothetical protein
MFWEPELERRLVLIPRCVELEDFNENVLPSNYQPIQACGVTGRLMSQTSTQPVALHEWKVQEMFKYIEAISLSAISI